MLPIALRVFTRTAFLLSTAAVLSASCSRQSEGERCDYEWGGVSQDCDSGLQCTPCGNLQDGIVDRCCRSDGTVTDPRCTKAASMTGLTCNSHKNTPVTGAAGSGSAGKPGTGGSAGASGTAGSGTAGSATAGSAGTSDMQSTGGGAGQSGGGNPGE